MPRTPAQWHARFRQQAAWTVSTRHYLLIRTRLPANSRVLEVGCGTGAITSWLVEEIGCKVFGLERSLEFLRLAGRTDYQSNYCGGDAMSLPFSNCVFDAVVCHYFLLWTPDPSQILAEMTRVARPGGLVIAFAEPDYAGRIDFPPELANLGQLQAEALRRQGAEPDRGRQLAYLFSQADLRSIETGVMGNQWMAAPNRSEINSEWTTLENDMEGILPTEEMDRLKQINDRAWASGERVLFIPTFFARGVKKDCQNKKERL